LAPDRGMTLDGLVFVEQKPREGREVEVTPGAVIGREGTDIVLPDPEVSRRHAAIRVDAEVVAIEDLGSTNGTFVNDERITGPRPAKGPVGNGRPITGPAPAPRRRPLAFGQRGGGAARAGGRGRAGGRPPGARGARRPRRHSGAAGASGTGAHARARRSARRR